MTIGAVTGDWTASQGVIPEDLPTIPGYQIVRELGRGGMGVVYQATQSATGRAVALKLIRDGALAGPQQRARFRIEAEAASRMQHPNLVGIYEVGEHLGRPYFAMELIEGGSLDQHLAGQPQPAKQSAELARTLARAVQHAHTQKIIHRDLKPANILLVGVRGQGSESRNHGPFIPKITDFGLAKRLDTDSTAWTQDGAILGTANYMSPEQAAGKVADIGPASDVYSLGVILYEMLTGRPPFLADSWNKLIDRVLNEEPTPPARLLATVPGDLETVCLKCLEKDPGSRYSTAAELADDLDRFLENKPIAAVPASSLERLTRLAARDGYQLIEEIGRGPRSTVYRALSGTLGQPVAIKVFHAVNQTREEWEIRLKRNTDLHAALTHPQIIPIHRVGWWDGAGYLVMEYVPQGSLASRIAQQDGRTLKGKKHILYALQIVEKVAEVVTYLHRQGVVHGNLKPSNIMLAADGIPRLVDFLFTGGLFQGQDLTEGDPTGLAYVPPELVKNPQADLRFYTDIYGLGLLLYELVTNRPPFAADTAQEMLEQACHREPVPSSQSSAEVPPNVDAFCLRCLNKNPWMRYARAYDVLTRVQYFQYKATGVRE